MKTKIPKGKDNCTAINKQLLKESHHAKLTIHNLDAMDKKELRRLVLWLDEIGSQIILKKPSQYSKRATWRLMK